MVDWALKNSFQHKTISITRTAETNRKSFRGAKRHVLTTKIKTNLAHAHTTGSVSQYEGRRKSQPPHPAPGLSRRLPARWICHHSVQFGRKVWSRPAVVCRALWTCRHKMYPMATSPVKTSTRRRLGAGCFHWERVF